MEDSLPNFASLRYDNKRIRCQLSFDDLRSMCPLTHTKDSYNIVLTYMPNRLLIETDSFQEYLSKYATMEIFQEEIVNTVMLDIILRVSPRWLKVELKTNIRRGTHNTVVQEWSETIGFHHSPEIGEGNKLTGKLKVDVPFKSGSYSRITIISGGRKELATPTFFPAVSSRQSFALKGLLELLLSEKYPRLYISAYDIYEQPEVYNTETILSISRNFMNGCTVMVDSGCFESHHRDDSKWSHGKYKEAINKIKSDYYMAFDPIPRLEQSKDEYQKKLFSNLNESRDIQSGESHLVAILHGMSPDSLIVNVKHYLDEYKGKETIIAIPERECGESLLQRCRTIINIRRILSNSQGPQILHILGCGDPISISTYVYCGADSFDSAEWTQYLVDPVDLKKRSISHLQLMKCDCKACRMTLFISDKKALMHNLLFYQSFMTKLQDMIKYGTLRDFLITTVGKDMVSQIDEN